MSETTNGTQTDTDTAEAAAGAGVVPQMDLGEMLDSAIRKAVTGQINAQAKDIADGVVAAMLTPEVRAGMRETAILEATVALEQALDPKPEPAPEPEPEPEEPADEETAEDEEEKPKELLYRNLEAFVRGCIANLYRREVSARGSEKLLRWCPCWWDHGEAVFRLEALWRAFEQLRLGGGVEMDLWWIQHADPQMDRLLDPEGPFKYCSVVDGHKAKMPALPTVAAPEGLFPDGHAADDTDAAVAAAAVPASSLLPGVPQGRGRKIMEFPG
ncbi:DUF4913 domain-containing protein [Nocardia cyriacigeorgica]|uniref:DUF4913 domain-containing protein n=1 Tax=Nocardia cyriacigeorgica TaxID=135487 RepID=UPI001893A5FE|nr:DUF4913 domain-containing protein [Nocardia cyriacigeorgica]MBF6162995.1 DUF4913 domain-containing protein [Nocardia cyriacigeorgica]MBF6201974.1 DUF4913 domain-containing protein [Nocardia cyriacigeorgica]